MFTDMEKWAEIRRLVKVEKRSKRSVLREFNIHWDTLVKVLEHTEPPGYRQARPRAKRKIGPFLEIIDEILAGDKTVHRKQHHTARRIFDRLKDEYGYPGGYTAVKEVVRDRRLRQREVFRPLAHRPAEAQVDFADDDVIWEGHQRRLAVAHRALGNGVCSAGESAAPALMKHPTTSAARRAGVNRGSRCQRPCGKHWSPPAT